MTDFMDGLDEAVDGQLPPEWDPPEDERVWYRHSQTGDRGYHVRRQGRDMVRLDRPNEEITRPMSGSLWSVDKDHRPLTRMHTARIAFGCDSLLRQALGSMRGEKDWNNLSEKQRIFWMNEGPEIPLINAQLYAAVMLVLAQIEG